MIDPSVIKDNWGWAIPGPPGQGPGQSATSTSTGGGNTMANTSTTSGGSTFNYPSEWGQAGDFWSKLASGNYSNQGMDWLTNLMQSGGSPVDVSGWGKAQQPLMMQNFQDMTKQMAEQAGVGGTRYSSGLQGQIARYGGQLQNQFQSDLMDRWLQSQEAGAGRAYGAGNLLSQLGLGAQTSGAEGLMSLGNLKSQLPLQVASMMGGLGGQLTNQQVDPWTQMMMQLIGPTGQYNEAQTYQPTQFQDILRGLSQTIPAGLEAWDKQGWW